MALVYDGMLCAICGAPIESVASENVFATTYYAIDHPEFRKLDDAAVHDTCMASWEHRDAFVAYYNRHCCNELKVNKHGHVIHRLTFFKLITDTPAFYISAFILVPLVGWSGLLGKTRIGIAIATLIPIITTISVGLLVVSYFGILCSIVATIMTWLFFVYTGGSSVG